MIARFVPAVAAGVIGSLICDLVIGVLIQMTGMIAMIAMLVGSKSLAVGWLVHLAIAAFIGASYAVLFLAWQPAPAAPLCMAWATGS